nr:hypothetical protein [Micromonospora sp. DSM 115978]
MRTRTNNGLLRAVGGVVAGVSVVAMVAVGCGGGSDDDQADDGGSGGGGGVPGASDVVSTSSGPVRGTTVSEGVTAYLGVPY